MPSNPRRIGTVVPGAKMQCDECEDERWFEAFDRDDDANQFAYLCDVCGDEVWSTIVPTPAMTRPAGYAEDFHEDYIRGNS